jgi:hypothetical protein
MRRKWAPAPWHYSLQIGKAMQLLRRVKAVSWHWFWFFCLSIGYKIFF